MKASALHMKAPSLARSVDVGLHDHLERKVKSAYGTGVRSWVRFAQFLGVDPWPPTPIEYCGWLHKLVQPNEEGKRQLQVNSLDVYKAGVRNACILEGHGWPLKDDEMVRRTTRYLQKAFPVDPKGRKVPVTVPLLKKVLPFLLGWPDMARMSPDDRVFAAASIMAAAVSAYLRGGEFLASNGSTRPVLKNKDIQVVRTSERRILRIKVPAPKARKFLKYETALCFPLLDDDEFCPYRLRYEYLARVSPELRKPDAPALCRGGKALTRDYMVNRTHALMVKAGISFVDKDGVPMDMQASSWRAGAASSAVMAGIPDRDIMAFGRWSSKAWENYVMSLPVSLVESARSMWAMPAMQDDPQSSGLRVVEFDVGGFIVNCEAPELKALGVAGV